MKNVEVQTRRLPLAAAVAWSFAVLASSCNDDARPFVGTLGDAGELEAGTVGPSGEADGSVEAGDAGGAPSNLLLNGSFEEPAVTSPPWYLRSASNTPGWTQILDGVDLIQNAYTQSGTAIRVLVEASDGVQYLDMNQAGILGGIEQVVAASAGKTYRLTLDTCAWAQNSVPGTIGYALYDPASAAVLATDTFTDATGGTWIPRALEATATSSSIGVRIQGTAAHQAGMGLDNVRLEAP